MNCAMSLSSQLRFWGMMSCKDPTRRMSLFMSSCYNYFVHGVVFGKDFGLVLDF